MTGKGNPGQTSEHPECVDGRGAPSQAELSSRYETLISALAAIEKAADKAKNDLSTAEKIAWPPQEQRPEEIALEAGRQALVVVLRFLQQDPRIVRLGLNRSLVEVYRAVHDTLQGAKPPLFFKARINLAERRGALAGRKRVGDLGAPTHLSAVVRRAQMVLALEVLIKARIAKPEASKWLADELHRHGLTDATGKRVHPKSLLRWHAERGGKSIRGFDAAYKKLEATEIQRGWPTEPARARRRSAKLILVLKLSGF